MNENRPSLIKLTNSLYRCTQNYTDTALKKFELSCGTYPFILELNKNEGISQNQLSRELNIDKAMSARVISKLIDLQYVRKEENSKDCRAYKLFLTDKAKAIIPDIIHELHKWIYITTDGLDEQERDTLTKLLERVLFNAKNAKAGD